MERFDAIIAGGGLAGSAAGNLLARSGAKVLILEKTSVPEDKVCGEFLSPAVWPFLKLLGLEEDLSCSGAIPVPAASFHFSSGHAANFRLPARGIRTGFGLSRKKLDETLLCAAGRAGCEVRRGCIVGSVTDSAGGYELETVSGGRSRNLRVQSPHFIDARGMRRASVTPSVQTGFKAHFHGPSRGEVEIYFFEAGYLGIGPVEDGRLNLCGLIDGNQLKNAGGNFDRILTEISRRHPALANRLSNLARVSPWLACPIRYGFQRGPRLRIGDAACFVEPFLGHGMTLALASGCLAAERLAAGQLAAKIQKAVRRLYLPKLIYGRAIRPAASLIGRLPAGLPMLGAAVAKAVCAPPYRPSAAAGGFLHIAAAQHKE